MSARVTVVTTLLAAVAFGQQSQDRVFHFADTDSEQQMQEIATVIRAIGEIKDVSVDTGNKTFSLRGTADQANLADWLLNELDRATHTPATREYRMGNATENVVRIFYLPYTETLQQFQELATMVRSVAEIRRVFTYNAPRVMVMRGTPEQAAFAEWLFNQVEKKSAAGDFRLRGSADDVARVFFLPHTATVQDFQEVATVTRSIAQIRRLFTYNVGRAVAARGTADQMALADWLFKQLDNAQPAAAAPAEFKVGGSADDIVKLFYMPQPTTPQRLQEMGKELRESTGLRLVFTYSKQNAILLRGSSGQLSQIATLIK